jgi:hypothetical protein
LGYDEAAYAGRGFDDQDDGKVGELGVSAVCEGLSSGVGVHVSEVGSLLNIIRNII